MTSPDFAGLDRVGLNLQAVFDIDDLPAALAAEIRERYDPDCRYRQLILIGHGGKVLWDAVKASGISSPDPIDDFSIGQVARCLAGHRHAIIYPDHASQHAVGLQALGQLAGWHHASPFMVGINANWGSWYAYRVVALSATDFPTTPRRSGPAPCAACRDRVCIAGCPAGALSGPAFDLEKCIAYRRQPASRCRDTCLARVACPVGAEHRYGDEQLRHTYAISLRMIERCR